jgi:hypothetical protein
VGKEASVRGASRAVLVVALFPGFGCQQRKPPYTDALKLTSLDGMELRMIGPLDDGPPDAVKWLRVITVNVTAEGKAKVVDVRDASRWRGIGLPIDSCPSDERPKIAKVRVAEDGGVSCDGEPCENLSALSAKLEPLSRDPSGLAVNFDSHPGARWRDVLRALAMSREWAYRIVFPTPPPDVDWLGEDGRSVAERFKSEGTAARQDGFVADLPVMCIRIRAAGKADYAAVQQAMLASVYGCAWRLSFTGLREGQEVEIGRLRVEQEEPWLGLKDEPPEPTPDASEP